VRTVPAGRRGMVSAGRRNGGSASWESRVGVSAFRRRTRASSARFGSTLNALQNCVRNPHSRNTAEEATEVKVDSVYLRL
jgi:hypothetical protein